MLRCCVFFLPDLVRLLDFWVNQNYYIEHKLGDEVAQYLQTKIQYTARNK